MAIAFCFTPSSISSSTKFNPLRPIPSLSFASPALRLSTASLPSFSHCTFNFPPRALLCLRRQAMMVMKEACRSLDSVPKDLEEAIQDERIPGSVVDKYFELEKSGMLVWLLQFAGFWERLLADDLFLFKVFMECGVGLFTKTTAEYQKREDNLFNELQVVFADVVWLSSFIYWKTED